MSWFLESLKKYAVFRGRSRRREYWYFVLFSLIIGTALPIVDAVTGAFDAESGTGLLGGIFSLAILLPSISVQVRRLHDIGRTGWWYPIILVPLIGAIVLLVFAVQDSEPYQNRFGPSPKAAAVA